MNSRDAHTPATDEQALEQTLQEKGLVYPRVTPEQLDSVIVEKQFFRPTGTLTICVLTLKNGFNVTGESACVDPRNFDEQVGQDIAYRNARDKIWSLEGYHLASKIQEDQTKIDQIKIAQAKIEQIAKVCHEANRAYCQALGDNSQTNWENASNWQKRSAINGVIYHLDNPNSTPADSHNSWLAEKEADGWKYGPVKDPEKKEHPCFVPYEQLLHDIQAKDYIFLAIVRALAE